MINKQSSIINPYCSRRQSLRIGAGGIIGTMLAASANPAYALRRKAKEQKARACILLWMGGGPSQIDTFDPKPGTDTGGPFSTIRTKVTGVHLAEHLPNLAAQMRDLAIIRSMTSREGNHDRASYLMHTGYRPEAAITHPALGSLIAKELGNPDSELPNFISLGGPSHGPGHIGVEYRPYVVNNPGYAPANLYPRDDITQRRQRDRMKLLNIVEEQYVHAHPNKEQRAHADVYTKAVRMMNSRLSNAFDISQETPGMTRAYNTENSRFGRGCLTARRLVQAGVRFVEVRLGGWDTHRDNFESVKRLSGEFDQPMAALIRDLEQRGMLDETLVVWMGEFGRTPRINDNTGRDHFPRCWSAVVAGGGVQGGQVIGATNKTGTEVSERPVQVADLFTSFAHAFGLDPRKEFVTQAGRPVTLVQKGGKVVTELFG